MQIKQSSWNIIFTIMLINFLSCKYIIVLFTLATKDRSPNTHSAGTLSDYLLVDLIKYKLTNHPRYMDLMLQCWRIIIPNAHLRFILSVFTLRAFYFVLVSSVIPRNFWRIPNCIYSTAKSPFRKLISINSWCFSTL